jgi:hypothetical protein
LEEAEQTLSLMPQLQMAVVVERLLITAAEMATQAMEVLVAVKTQPHLEQKAMQLKQIQVEQQDMETTAV